LAGQCSANHRIVFFRTTNLNVAARYDRAELLGVAQRPPADGRLVDIFSFALCAGDRDQIIKAAHSGNIVIYRRCNGNLPDAPSAETGHSTGMELETFWDIERAETRRSATLIGISIARRDEHARSGPAELDAPPRR
jgi:hypothetical protein